MEEIQRREIQDFLLAAWAKLRNKIAAEIFPGDTEQNVADTDRMLVAAAKAGVSGRL